MSEKPIVLAFCCHYCAYAAADLAGSMRLAYPQGARVVRLPCTGKVDILHILRSFEKGADGVYAVGCMEGDCHYTGGNFRARKRIEQAKKILDTVGVGGERVEMFNLSAGMGGRFAEIVREMDERMRALGPSPIRVAKSTAPKPGREVRA